MPKRTNLKPSISKEKIDKGDYLYTLEYGPLDQSTYLKFNDPNEEEGFEKACDDCVNQTESYEGLSPLLTRDMCDLADGEMYKTETDIIVLGSNVQTLRNIPDILTENDFIENARKHSNGIAGPEDSEGPRIHEIISDLSAEIFNLNKSIFEIKHYGKMMYLFSIICAYCSRYDYLINEEQVRRDKLLNKLKTVEDLFNYGLVTGSLWSSVPFWNNVKTRLMIEYDSTQERGLFNPFTQQFLFLKQIKLESIDIDNLIHSSILSIVDKFEIFKKFYGKGSALDDDVRKRKITDRFKNLPKQDPNPRFEIYSYQQKL